MDHLVPIYRNGQIEEVYWTYGYSPVTALELAERCRPQVAVLDIGLPVMDGYELAARLRGNQVTVACRLVAVTGYGQAHDQERSLRAGFQHHLVKPVDMDQLARIVAAEAPGK